jgi:hypothetical protein
VNTSIGFEMHRPPAREVNRRPQTTAETGRFVEALNAHRMGGRLAAALGRGVHPCHVLDAKYEPGVQGLVLYAYGSDLVRGDLLMDGSTAGRDTAVVEPGMRLSVFPHEPSLPALPRVMAPAEIGPVLAAAIPHLASEHALALARRCRVELLRYRPGRRATVRVRTARALPVYVGKVYHDGAKAAAVADEARGLADTLTADGTLRFAPTLAHLPELSLVVQGAVRGQSLGGLLSGSAGAMSAAADGVRRAAAALAQLHRSPTVTARQRPVDKELRRFVTRAARVSSADPLTGSLLRGLAERLLETYDSLPPGRMGMVHGDCKPAQFMLGRDVVYLLDLDHCGISDQAGDVGTFVASLRQLAVRRLTAGAQPASVVDVLELAATFRRAYLRHFDDDSLPARILWHEAVALQRKALRAFARAPRSRLTAALVTDGHRCLDQLRSGSS